MRHYVIKIGFSTNNSVSAAELQAEIMDAIQAGSDVEVTHTGYVIVPDEIITESDFAADARFDEQVDDAYALERMVQNVDDQA